MSATPELTDPFSIGEVEIENRILLAPLAGIGNWFVRMQARRHGAGMAVSEMVSSYAIRHGNRRTLEEMLRIESGEHPVAVQLFGPDPDVMRGAAETVAEAGADIVDLNMGCPVPKVCKTGAGAALIGDPDRAIAVARAAREGSGLPVTVKVRSGLQPGDRSGLALAIRLAEEGGVAAIAFHPRPASVHHSGAPDYELARELRERVEVPVIISGGLRTAELARHAFRSSGADAVMIARGSLGNPWIFEELAGRRQAPPSREEIAGELEWVLDAGVRHWGPERAARNLRKFYPWYLEQLGIAGPDADAFQRTESVEEVRSLLEKALETPAPAALSGREYAPL
jgi:nifR3 family TIM-barrel protein